ncbi:MAG: DUF4349 domain-containing protein [Leifsonia sp.]
MKRAPFATVVAVASALLLAGCTASGGSADSGAAPGIAQAPATGDKSGFAADGEESAPGVAEDRSVITTGFMAVTAEDPVVAAGETAAITASAGGRIDSRNEQPGTGTQAASAALVIRVPSARFEAVVADLGKLGDVTSFSTDATDVTQQKQDLDARIRALETSTARLTALMGSATTTADLIEIENALSTRQAELDSLTTQRDAIADQVEYSTLSVQFTAPGVVAPGRPTTFWDGLVAGWTALVGFLAGTLVVIGALLPWLLLLGVLALIVVVIVRVARRPRGPKGPDGPPTPDAPSPEPEVAPESEREASGARA